MEKWKLGLIVSVVFSLICGIGATIFYLSSLFERMEQGADLSNFLEL